MKIVITWLFVAQITLLMVSAFSIWLARLNMASLVLVPLAKSLIC